MIFIISGVGASEAGGVLTPSATGRGVVLPPLPVLSLPAGAGSMLLLIVVLGSLVIGSLLLLFIKVDLVVCCHVGAILTPTLGRKKWSANKSFALLFVDNQSPCSRANCLLTFTQRAFVKSKF